MADTSALQTIGRGPPRNGASRPILDAGERWKTNDGSPQSYFTADITDRSGELF